MLVCFYQIHAKPDCEIQCVSFGGRGTYLSGMDASQLESFPPSFLANRNASAYLPDGEDSGQLRRLMTELQMLLHAHPVNEERERLGKLPVNSLWFWFTQ